ncbi:MAG: ATP-binding protein [Candidatus Gastranaerophilales bacterium]|nr:ATP-binding protein [Candidatus Gastranaerophilales bacterium]
MNIAIHNLQTKHFTPYTDNVISNKKITKHEQNYAPNNLNLVDTHYQKLLVKSSNVSFGGALVPILPPLEKRISAALHGLTAEDLILVGKSLSSAKKSLLESIEGINKVIKRIFFIEDPSLSGSFAIHENPNRLYEIINLDKLPILLKVRESSQAYVLKKSQSAYLTHIDSVILANNSMFKVFKEAEKNIDDIKKAQLRLFDFSNYDKKAISNLNSKHLSLVAEKGIKEEVVKKITFADVGGQDEAIGQLKKRILYPMQYPAAYPMQGSPRGIILTGGPGTGKTLMAEALANEADAHIIKLNGLEMESKWVGETEANWRALFEEAKDNQPSILFIDEFDAVARMRDGSSTGRYDNKVVNQLLTLMSDLEKSNDKVFVVTATNKIGLLDDAIKRSGRFGDFIAVAKPTLEGCKKILGIHSSKSHIKVSPDFNQEAFAKKLFGSSVNGADISKLVFDAKQEAFERAHIFEKMEKGIFKDKDIQSLLIETSDFEKALEKFKAQQALTDGDMGRNLSKKRIGFDNAVEYEPAENLSGAKVARQ